MSSKNALSNLIELTSNVADAFTTALYQTDMETGTLKLRAHLTLSSHLDTGAEIPIDENSLPGKAALLQKPITEDFSIKDIPEMIWYTHDEDIKGLMVVPVVRKDLEGVLLVDSKENYSFTPKLEKLILGFADQMAWYLSLENKNPNWIDGEPPDFQPMMKWCRFLAESPHRKALSERFLNVPRTLIHSDATAVVWMENDGVGRVTHSKGWGQSLKSLTIESGTGLCGTCLDRGQPVLIRNTMNRTEVVFDENEELKTFRSLMVAPIISEKRMLGMVVCGTKQPDGLRQRELDKLTLMTAFAQSVLSGSESRRSPEYILKTYKNIPEADSGFLPVHLKSFEAEIINRDSPVAVISINIANINVLFPDQDSQELEALLDQMALHLSERISTLKLISKWMNSGLVLLLIGITEEEAYEREQTLQEELSELDISIAGEAVAVEFDYGLASFPTDGNDLKILIETSWAQASQTKEKAHG